LAASFSSNEEFDEKEYRRSDAMGEAPEVDESVGGVLRAWASPNVVHKHKPL
jgi:hypothetical protein